MRQKNENKARLAAKRRETELYVCVCPTLTFLAFLVITVDLKDDYCYSCTLPPHSLFSTHSHFKFCLPASNSFFFFFFFIFLLVRNGQNVWEMYANVCDNVIAKG